MVPLAVNIRSAASASVRSTRRRSAQTHSQTGPTATTRTKWCPRPHM